MRKKIKKDVYEVGKTPENTGVVSVIVLFELSVVGVVENI